MRTQKTVKNMIYDLASYFITTVARFVVRTVFIVILGTELLGLNGLFVSIIAMFSLAELGFGIAMGNMMYKPIAEKDTEKIKSYIALARKIFFAIGILILVGGVAITPFIEIFISEYSLPIAQIRIYFLLFVAFSAVSYFNVHKVVLINADQHKYIEQRIVLVFNLITSLFQVLVMLWLRSFAAFLVIQIITVIAQNICLSVIVNKKYPFIKEKNIQKLQKSEKNELTKKVLALSFYKIGAVVMVATDSLIISNMLGLTMVGFFLNYTMITVSVTQLAYQIVGGSVASVGNLWVTDGKKHAEEVFKAMQLVQFWLSAFCTTALLVLMEPFIIRWLGADFLLGQGVVIALCVSFYLSTMRSVVKIFKESKGLYWQDKYKPIIEVVVNLAASIILTYFLGVVGTILGTILSIISCSIWVEPIILFKIGFEKSPKNYFIDYFFKMLLVAIIAFGTYYLCGLFGESTLMFIIKMIVCTIVPNIVLFLIFRKTHAFQLMIGTIKGLVRRKSIKVQKPNN